MQFARLTFPVILLAITTQAHALCRPGTVVLCSIFGKPGTKECLGDGEFDVCKPNPGGQAIGSFFGKFFIMTVVYAPPGTTAAKTTTGEQGFSSVNYGSDSTTGTTTSVAHSFKQSYQVSASLTCSICDIGLTGGGASFTFATNETDATALTTGKKTSSTITDNGPVEDAVDHNFDQIWLLLRPKFDVTLFGTKIVWTLDPDQSAGELQYLYVGQLNNVPQFPIGPGLLRDLQTAGITRKDFEVILTADPLAGCLPPERLPGARVVSPPPLPFPCVAPAPTLPRYVLTPWNLPYDPPAEGNAVPLQTMLIDNSSLQTTTTSYKEDYTYGVTATNVIPLGFLDDLNATLSTQDSWTTETLNTTAAQTGTEQKASLTLGGPAFGYTGLQNMDVYFDTLYQTFAFVPTGLSPLALHGTILSSQGKPAVGQLVTATAGRLKYRTFTNAKGEYHFSRKFAGPIDIRTGSITRHLPGFKAGKSVDLRLQ